LDYVKKKLYLSSAIKDCCELRSKDYLGLFASDMHDSHCETGTKTIHINIS